MAKPNWLQRIGDIMLASQTTSPTSVTGGDAYQPRAMAEFRKGDVEKAKEIQQKDDLRNLQAMAFGAAVASLPASAATIGWIPTLTTEAAGWAGSVGAGYLGNNADQKLGTNWIGPTAGIVGGMLSGAGAYRGMVNAGSKGLLKGSGNMYGSRFRSDVAADMMNNSIKTVEPKTILSTTPVIRTKVGDLEIDDPHLYYRQGTHHVGDDFLKSGIVQAGTTNHVPIQQVNGITLTKRAFGSPMFSKGKLWYGVDDTRYTDVLVASPSAKMQMATVRANPTTNASKAGVRRIPAEVLTNKATRLYRWVPGYGYLDMSKPRTKVSYELLQRPSKLSFEEYSGVPKSVRNNKLRMGDYGEVVFKNGDATINRNWKNLGSGSEQSVFQPDKHNVLKIHSEMGGNTIDEALELNKNWVNNRNLLPGAEKLHPAGTIWSPQFNKYFAVNAQRKMDRVLSNDMPSKDFTSILERLFIEHKLPYVKDKYGDIKVSLEDYVATDFQPSNIGEIDGKFKFIDIDILPLKK